MGCPISRFSDGSELRNTRASDDATSMNYTDTGPYSKDPLKHHTCGEDCRLGLALNELDSAVKINNTTSRINDYLTFGATKFVESIARALKDADPIWSCSVERRGSTTNGLKTGRLDEIDFLLKCDSICLSAQSGWQLKHDRLEFHEPEDTNYGAISEETYDSNFQIVCERVPRAGKLYRFVTQQGESSHSAFPCSLSASKLKEHFKGQLKGVLEEISSIHGSTNETGTVPFIIDDRSGNPFYFPKNVSHAVKIDITLCLSYTNHCKKKQWLVPKSGLKNWGLVSLDPKELTFKVVRQAIRIVKTLRDINETATKRDGTDGPVIARNKFFVMENVREYVHMKHHLSTFVTQQLGSTTIPAPARNVPSYAILGTVVQCYRRNTRQPLCSLVLNSLLHFQLADPDGNPFCGSKQPGPNVQEYHTILHSLLTAETAEIERVASPSEIERATHSLNSRRRPISNPNTRNVLPVYYEQSTASIEHFSKEDRPPSDSTFHEEDRPEAFCISDDKSNNTALVASQVYRVDRQEFGTFLLNQASWDETDLELGAELREVQRGEGPMYIGELRLEDACWLTNISTGAASNPPPRIFKRCHTKIEKLTILKTWLTQSRAPRIRCNSIVPFRKTDLTLS